MLGMISAAIVAMVLFASQRAFPDINERFKSFSSIGYLLLAGAFAVFWVSRHLLLCGTGLQIPCPHHHWSGKNGLGYGI